VSSPAKSWTKEVTWSIGEYMYGREIWDSFKLPGDPPQSVGGVYENQPSTVATNVTGVWVAFAGLLFSCSSLWRSSTCTQKSTGLNHTYQFNRAEAKNELLL